jgi:transcriptional regulator with XRE-family HTH domain
MLGGMEDEDVVIGANIRRLRQVKGMSQTELAHAMQAAGRATWHQTTVSRVERGLQPVEYEDAGPLTEIIGDFLEGTEVKVRVQEATATLSRAFASPEFQETMRKFGETMRPRWRAATGGKLPKLREGLDAARASAAQLQQDLDELDRQLHTFEVIWRDDDGEPGQGE